MQNYIELSFRIFNTTQGSIPVIQKILIANYKTYVFKILTNNIMRDIHAL